MLALGGQPQYFVFLSMPGKFFSVYNASVECKLHVKKCLEKINKMSLVFTLKKNKKLVLLPSCFFVSTFTYEFYGEKTFIL